MASRTQPRTATAAVVGLAASAILAAILGLTVLSIVAVVGLGALGWLLVRSRVEERGQAFGLRQDLTELRNVMDIMAEGLVVVDGEQRILHINRAGANLFDLDPTEAVGEQPWEAGFTWLDRRGERLSPSSLPAARALHGEEVRGLVIGIQFPDQHRRWVRVSSRMLSAEPRRGEPFLVVTFSDETEEIEAQDAARAETSQLRYRALHDSLTGLPNRTLLMDRLAHAKQNAERRGAATGLLVIDLDGFKGVNDNLGHAAGDEVLVQVAVRLRTTLRNSDTAARLGGDEFVILCEDLHPGMADLELSRISERVEALLNEPYVTTVGPADVGASVGWALSQPGEALDLDLVVAADEAMLAAKRERKRNRTDPKRDMGEVPTESDEQECLDVFIVDDDPAMRLLASRILESSGTRLRVIGEAPDGPSAIPAILEREPDVVLCDVMMPTVSGPEVVSAVRATNPKQLFIFWSATTAPELQGYEASLGVPFVLKDRIEELPSALLEAADRALAASLSDGAQVTSPSGRS